MHFEIIFLEASFIWKLEGRARICAESRRTLILHPLERAKICGTRGERAVLKPHWFPGKGGVAEKNSLE